MSSAIHNSDFAYKNAQVNSRLRIQKARRERQIANLNERRKAASAMSLSEIVQASAQEAQSSESEANEDTNGHEAAMEDLTIEKIQSMMQMDGIESAMGSEVGGNKKRKRKNKGAKKNNQRGLKLSQNLRMYAKQLQLWDYLLLEDLPML